MFETGSTGRAWQKGSHEVPLKSWSGWRRCLRAPQKEDWIERERTEIGTEDFFGQFRGRGRRIEVVRWHWSARSDLTSTGRLAIIRS